MHDTQVLDHTKLFGAARAVGAVVGLDDDTEISADRPAGWDGRLLAASFSGPYSGTVYLGVSAELAEQLTDPEVAPAVLGAVFLALALPTDGIDVDAFASAVEQPADIVTITHALTGTVVLFGLALGASEATGQPRDYDLAPMTVGVDPTPMSSGAGRADSSWMSSMSLLDDVDMDVTVELGRTKMPIRELLALQPGMVVEIDRIAGAPVDVLVNGQLIASGEVVVIDDEFGLRITEIISIAQVS